MVYIPKKGEVIEHYENCPCSGCKFGITSPVIKVKSAQTKGY